MSSIEDLQNLSLTTSGAVISVGTITSKDVGTCNISVSSSGTVTLGDLNFQTIAGGESFLTFPASFRFTYFEIK